MIGITINHENMTDNEVTVAATEYADTLSLPATDPLWRDGSELVDMVTGAFPHLLASATPRRRVISPRIEIDLAKIEHNTRDLVTLLAHQGISVTGITKATLGLPEVAEAMIAGGVARIGDSRIANLERLREAGITTPMMLIRSPTPDECERAVAAAVRQPVTELDVIHALSRAAEAHQKTHDVVLMVELGDLREGVLPQSRRGDRPPDRQPGTWRSSASGRTWPAAMASYPTVDQMAELGQLDEPASHRTGDRAAADLGRQLRQPGLGARTRTSRRHAIDGSPDRRGHPARHRSGGVPAHRRPAHRCFHPGGVRDRVVGEADHAAG